MADLMWSTVKEPLDTTLCFDKESLDLAFKYFMSPTLTMRLAGLSQITVSYFCFIFGNFLFAFSRRDLLTKTGAPEVTQENRDTWICKNKTFDGKDSI